MVEIRLRQHSEPAKPVANTRVHIPLPPLKLRPQLWGWRTRVWNQLRKLRMLPQAYFDHDVYPYDVLVERMLAKPSQPYTWFRCVTPAWDNSARRAKDATIFRDSTPALYESWLRAMIQTTVTTLDGDERLLFVNAWNEWAEGNHLEPDQRWGRAYLEATLRSVIECAQQRCESLTETA